MVTLGLYALAAGSTCATVLMQCRNSENFPVMDNQKWVQFYGLRYMFELLKIITDIYFTGWQIVSTLLINAHK